MFKWITKLFKKNKKVVEVTDKLSPELAKEISLYIESRCAEPYYKYDSPYFLDLDLKYQYNKVVTNGCCRADIIDTLKLLINFNDEIKIPDNLSRRCILNNLYRLQFLNNYYIQVKNWCDHYLTNNDYDPYKSEIAHLHNKIISTKEILEERLKEYHENRITGISR